MPGTACVLYPGAIATFRCIVILVTFLVGSWLFCLGIAEGLAGPGGGGQTVDSNLASLMNGQTEADGCCGLQRNSANKLQETAL
jgi:hypothetical protein